MKEVLTKIRFGAVLFVTVSIGFVILFFFPFEIMLRILLFLIWIAYNILDISQLNISELGVKEIYPFNPFYKKEIVCWDRISKVNVWFRNAFFHGALMSSYIELVKNNSKKDKVHFRLSKEELEFLKSMAETKGFELNVKNNPYDQSLELN